MSELALKLIHEAKEKRQTRLDLGSCGLTEIPEQLFELTWLEELILGEIWLRDSKNPRIVPEKSLNTGPKNAITKLPEKISQLKELSAISFSRNNILDISPLASLTKLSSLDMMGNGIQDIASLAFLTELKGLNLCGNGITDIHPLSSLTSLSTLYLSDNQIKEIYPLKNLTNLQYLYLSNNLISELPRLESMKNIYWLNLSGNEISSIKNLGGFKKINRLDLMRNKINDISPISTLASLDRLSLSKNLISNISSVKGLERLTWLNLEYNQVKDISPLKNLRNLNSLYLRNNQINDLSPLLEHIKNGRKVTTAETNTGANITVYNNPLERPSKEVIEQGNQAILDYFCDLETQGTDKLNEAKLIIVGEPEAGKTSLMEALLNPGFELCPDTETTLGIEVREGWTFPHPQNPDIPFTTNIWDFGGQQIQYMTHQFFLTPGAAYVLVSANDRKEPTNFPYWFKIIHLLGEEKGVYSPVLVVLNEKDDKYINKFNFDLKLYQERYPELQISVREVDLSKRDGNYQALCDEVQNILTNLPHVTHDRPARWNDIRTTLRERAKTDDHITFEQYAEICRQYSVDKESSQLLFSGYLHRLGSLLHFKDDKTLYNFIILKPQWAVDAVYSVLNDNEIARSGGYFSRKQVETIWSEQKNKQGQARYNHDERLKLLSLMEKENFEICYPLDEQNYIAPQLLETLQPDYVWDAQDCLKFRFQYKFMPEGILTRLIVRLNSLIEPSNNGRGLVWRKGVVFSNEGCRAQVLEEEGRDSLKVIDIAVTGHQTQRKFLLREIRNEVQSIHKKWFRNIQSEQMIPCICDHCSTTDSKNVKFFEFSVLQRAQEREKITIECDKEFIDVPVMGLLEGVFDEKELHQQAQEVGHSHTYSSQPQSTPNVEIVVNNITPGHSLREPEVTSQHENLMVAEPATPWHKEWWIISMVIAIMVGLIAGLAFLSIKIGAIGAVVAGIIVYFMNPKRRFFRAASVLIMLFGTIVTPPLISGYVKSQQQVSNNQYVDFAINIGDAMNPWLTGVTAFTALVGAGFLFWLDYKQG